nr:insulin receptor substrate 1-like [Ciona intestinalis]|eukprot:XP_002128395.1 insulin receptor substrate 1-like [Ciona intestinalis]
MAPEPDYSAMSTDIVLKGTLRKAKTWNKRFFVLRDGNPPKLEYYENERKWKVNKPKRQISLGNPWNIDKKKDTKHEFLIVIFTKDEYFTMAAESADVQQTWISALLKTVRPAAGLTMFKYIWQVVLENKELEMSSSNLSLHGQHRICLTHDSMVFVACNDRCNNTPAEILITNIRLCGHKENMFFIEPGRASGIGNGKLWMDVGDDAMAAQMHTTILNVMYALRQEEASCSYRGRSNSSGSNSSRTRTTRTHHNPPPSQIGMGKISSAKRNRCDSLPASHVVGLQDSRLRTGSEGENTMKRPLRYNSMRLTYGSTSPGMRNRLTPTYKRMSQHHVSHSHTSSLPGSCNSSSTASSTEHINHDFSSGYMSSSITCSAHTSEPTSADEYGSNSPTQTYIRKQQSSRSIADTQTACTPPIQEDGGYCPTCSHTFHPRHGTAPPPLTLNPPLTPSPTNIPMYPHTHAHIHLMII